MTRSIIATIAAVLLLSGSALAGKGPGSNNDHKTYNDQKKWEHGLNVGIAVDIVFTSREVEIIRNYFARNSFAWSSLPPGVAKNLARGKPLPPGIKKKALPSQLVFQLPHHEGYEYLSVGRDILLVAVATGIIVDILKDVF